MSKPQYVSPGPLRESVGGKATVAIGLVMLAVAGLASLMAAPVERIIPMEAPALLVRGLAIIQPAVLTAIALVVGLLIAPRVGLGAPYLSRSVRRDLGSLPLRRDLGLALSVAGIAGLVLAAYQLWSNARLDALNPEAAARIADFAPPLITRMLYGGLTEEVIARWGVMTLLVWLLSIGAPKGPVRPSWTYWVAAIVAGLLFALAHLPLLYTLMADPPADLLAAVIGLNTLVGVAFGWLFWRSGIETAMVSHALTHGAAAVLMAGATGLNLA